jgi:hypothetical protein
MKRSPLFVRNTFPALFGALYLCTAAANAQAVTVSGKANPWLAGLPDGSTAGQSPFDPQSIDVAPDHSPAVLSVTPGTKLMWTATGETGHPGDNAGPDGALYSWWPQRWLPDGNGSYVNGPENGMSDIWAPFNALLGVFLTDTPPDPNAAPATLTADLTSTHLAPELQQVFFMGDGLTMNGGAQKVHVPANATRLFMGIMDSYEWNNNVGEFRVEFRTVQCVPDAGGTFVLLGTSLVAVVLGLRKAVR